jgi:hypothetical protein
LQQLVTVYGTFPSREERLPLDPLGITDPALFAFSVAAGRLAFLEHGAFGAPEAFVNLLELRSVLDLNTKMLEAGFGTALADRKVDARVIEHPFGIVVLANDRFGREEVRVKVNRGREVLDCHMHV